MALAALLVQAGLLVCCVTLIYQLRKARFEAARSPARQQTPDRMRSFEALLVDLETQTREVRKAVTNGK